MAMTAYQTCEHPLNVAAIPAKEEGKRMKAQSKEDTDIDPDLDAMVVARYIVTVTNQSAFLLLPIPTQEPLACTVCYTNRFT